MPHFAVTVGDPAGIGPEVTQRALQSFLPEHPELRISLFGPRNCVDPMAGRLGEQVVACGQTAFLGAIAEPSAASGQAALAALDGAIAVAQTGAIDALVTAPLSKQALHLAGSASLGHTEILARHLGVGPVAMAFWTPRLRLVLATVHIPLRAVCTTLTAPRIVEVAQLFDTFLRQRAGVHRPHLALAGLNPHAGEGGLLGDEEQNVLQPAVHAARAAGIDLSEPISPDTVFTRAVDGEFAGVVALYHDQGLIPVKLLAFGAAVNITLGLRVLRTSPDHGTAYDRVGTGTARPDGMLGALRAAHQLMRRPTEEL